MSEDIRANPLDRRKEPRRIIQGVIASKEDLFKVHEMEIHSKEMRKQGVYRKEFIQELLLRGYEGLVFEERERDTIGKSNGKPTWGEVYTYSEGELRGPSVAIYKGYDEEVPQAAYCEKIWSIMGKIMLDNCRVPTIDLVTDKENKDVGVLSYRLLRRQTEELIDMRMASYKKFSRQQLKAMKGYLYIEDLFECVRLEIGDDEKFGPIKQSMLEVIMLDCMVNNPDRHDENWGIVKSKDGQKYDLAVFDHSATFVDLAKESPPGRTVNGWAGSYIRVTPPENWNNIHLVGDTGGTILGYIYKQYPSEFESFMTKFNDRIETFYQTINVENSHVEMNRMRKGIRAKQKQVDRMMGRGEDTWMR